MGKEQSRPFDYEMDVSGESKGTRPVKFDRFGENPYAEFISDSVGKLLERKRRLQHPAKVKAHGVRRPSRETRDIRTSRSPSTSQIDEAVRVLQGKDKHKSVIFLKDGNSEIVGFTIFNGRKRHRG